MGLKRGVLAYADSKTGCKQCVKVLEELEKIDDDADAHGINMVKIDDMALAKKYGVFAIPAILFFRNDDKDPVIYAGRWLSSGDDGGVHAYSSCMPPLYKGEK